MSLGQIIDTLHFKGTSAAVPNEDKQDACSNCTGIPCKKSRDSYFVAVFRENADGTLRKIFMPCKYDGLRQLRIQCGRAQIPRQYAGKTFDDYHVDKSNEQAMKIARWFAREKPACSLYIYGECGTGKTFLASIIAQEFMREFKRVIFGDVPTLLDEIKRTFDGRGNAAQIVDRYCDCDLLILDDLGAGQITEWSAAQLYQIINTRYNEDKPVIVTSNFDNDGLQRRLTLHDDFTAKRITSRLSEMCVAVFLGTADRRRKS